MADNTIRKYFVKESWIFNLEAMHDKLWCIMDDIDEGKIELPITICNKEINDSSDIQGLIEEGEKYAWIARSRKVTSAEYGRIKQLVAWRVEQRYLACMNSGMSEKDAGKCFEDM